MEENKKNVALVAVLVLLGVGLVFFGYFKRAHSPEPIIEKDSAFVCPGETKTMIMNDVYMRGVVEKDQSFTAISHWFACNKIENGQLALYRFSDKAEPVVRRIVAHEGDKIHLIRDEEADNWRLEVNGEEITATDGKPYAFGVAKAPPNLKTYEDANEGVLKTGLAVVLSAFPPGETDSGVFGVIAVSDLIAKVELVK